MYQHPRDHLTSNSSPAGDVADVERRLDAMDTVLETIHHDIKQIKLNLEDVKVKADFQKEDEGR
jgi:hypothetical protein